MIVKVATQNLGECYLNMDNVQWFVRFGPGMFQFQMVGGQTIFCEPPAPMTIEEFIQDIESRSRIG